MRILMATLLAMLSLGAQCAAPSNESLERLLRGMDAEKTVKGVQQYSEAMIKGTIERVAQVRPITPEQRAKLDDFTVKMTATMREELAWEKMKPSFLQIYSESFTQQEIDGLIRFYESPTGRAFIAKMPAVLNKSMTLMQGRMDALMQKIQGAIKETLEEK
jgi:uncharacterized protein